MADFLRVPHADIALAALIPSLLSYLALFIPSDLAAVRDGIAPVPRSEIPRLTGVVAKGWAFVLPFAVLICALFRLNQEAETAAIWSCLAVMAIGFLPGYGAGRLSLRKVRHGVVETGLSSARILMIAAASGFIMGILQLTGLGFALTMYLVALGGTQILILLIVAAARCIVLGMGKPTPGVWVLLAVLIAPAPVGAGVRPLAAQMFILYLGMMSFVTPPVAIGAVFAANLAGASPMLTAWVAMRCSWVPYIVPVLFVFAPGLLMLGDAVTILIAVATAAIGIWFVSAGFVGYGLTRIGPGLRALSVAGGAGLLIPPGAASRAWEADLAGGAVSAAVPEVELLRRRQRPAPAA